MAFTNDWHAEIDALALRAQADASLWGELWGRVGSYILAAVRKRQAYLPPGSDFDDLDSVAQHRAWLALAKWKPARSPYAHFAALNATRRAMSDFTRSNLPARCVHWRTSSLDEPAPGDPDSGTLGESVADPNAVRPGLLLEIAEEEADAVRKKVDDLEAEVAKLDYLSLTPLERRCAEAWLRNGRKVSAAARALGEMAKRVENAVTRYRKSLTAPKTRHVPYATEEEKSRAKLIRSRVRGIRRAVRHGGTFGFNRSKQARRPRRAMTPQERVELRRERQREWYRRKVEAKGKSYRPLGPKNSSTFMQVACPPTKKHAVDESTKPALGVLGPTGENIGR